MKGPMTHGRESNGPPMFSSFTEMATFFSQEVDSSPDTIPIATTAEKTRLQSTPELSLCVQSREIVPQIAASVPKSSILQVAAPSPEKLEGAAMAHQRAHHEPSMPQGFHRVTIQGRDAMAHAVISRPLARLEDYAIITIEPLLDQQVPFNVIHNTMRMLLEGQEGIRVAAIQPSTLGQALVKFEYHFDRDRMANNSPHDANGQ